MIRKLTLISLTCMILGFLLIPTSYANGTVGMSIAVGVKNDPAGGFTNADLNGRYYFRRFFINNFEASYREAEICYGYIDFNGFGSWTGGGTCFDSDGASSSFSSSSFNGTYSVKSDGSFTWNFGGNIHTGHISSDRNFSILSSGIDIGHGPEQDVITALRISDTSLLLSDLNDTWRFRELELHDFESVNRSAVICSGTMVCNNGNWNGNVECLDSNGSTNSQTVSGTYAVNGKTFDFYTTGNPEVLFSAYLSKDKNTFIFTRGSSSGNELFKGISVKEEAKTYTNADLSGSYFFHDAYIEDINTDNREFSITAGTVTFDGSGNWTGTSDSYDSDGSSGSDAISGTYSVNPDGSFTLIVTSETPDEITTGTISDDNNIIAFSLSAKAGNEGKPKAMPWIPLLLLYEEPSADYWVNSSVGSNANPGTENKPFKTITKALGLVTAGHTVYVAPGTYDLANGETFPLQLPTGAILIGDEANKGAGSPPTVIKGGSPTGFIGTSIEAGANSVIAGFTILNDNAGATFNENIVITNDGITLRNNHIIDGSHNGIYIYEGADNHTIVGNVIQGNTQNGLIFRDGGVGSLVEDNLITGNEYGVAYDSPGGDLGGGATGSNGGNIISCNTQNDLWTNSGVTIDAQNNFWDHVPPTVSDVGTADIDIRRDLSSTVITTGAMLAPSPCP